MEHSIALVTGATSGRGYAAARVITAAGVEAAQATLSGHHQLPVASLHSRVTNNLRRRKQ